MVIIIYNETMKSFNTFIIAVDVQYFFLKPDWNSDKAFLENRNSFN